MATTTSRKRARAVRGGQAPSRPVEADRILKRLARTGLTQREIGQAVGVSDRTVRTWRTRNNPTAASFDRLDALAVIEDILSDSLTSRGVAQWLRARNRLLDGRRPLDALAEGDADAVREAGDAFDAGSYV